MLTLRAALEKAITDYHVATVQYYGGTGPGSAWRRKKMDDARAHLDRVLDHVPADVAEAVA